MADVVADDKAAAAESYVQRLLAALGQQPERPLLRWRGTVHTAGAFRGRVHNIAARLDSCGVTAGDTVAILTEPNHPAMLAGRYAAHLLGAAVVHIRSANPRADDLLGIDAQEQLVRETSARFLVVDRAHTDRARRLREALAGEVRLVVLPLADLGTPGADTEDAVEPPTAVTGQAPAPVTPGAIAVIALTSGSTGRPKAIRQSFRTWNSLVRTFDSSADHTDAATMLVVTPVHHTVGSMVDAVLTTGGSVLLHERFEVAVAVRALRDDRVTDAYLAVPHLYQLLDYASRNTVDTSSLRRLIYSGTPAAPRRVAEAARLFGRAIFQLYGSTETGGISALTPLDHCEPELLATVGRPLPGVSVRVRDPESGADLPAGQAGEIWVRSPTTMDGYLGDPELTSQVLSGGWLRTGDLGHWDRYGYLRLVDRVAHVVKTGGLKVYPATVEQALLRHPDVTDAVVFGVRDADRVEHLHAAITVRAGVVCRPERLRAHVVGALSPAHAPAQFTVWPDLPRTEAGKPDRGYLRAHAEHQPDQAASAPAGHRAGRP